MFQVPESRRVFLNDPREIAEAAVGTNCGEFMFQSTIPGRILYCRASDGLGWEHVSVSSRQGKKVRTPTWGEMCSVKDVFWGLDDLVVQFHPRAEDYVNDHDHVLHLWKPIGKELPSPMPLMVGLGRKEFTDG